MRSLILIAVLLFPTLAYSQATWRGRNYSQPVCSSPSCTMCASIRAQLAQPRQHAPAGYRYETYRVKHCNGRTCWYETKRRLVRDTNFATRAHFSVKEKPGLQPTPMAAVDAMLSIVKPERGEALYDLGCGDGRILERAMSQHGCKVVGVDIDAGQLEKSRKRLGNDATLMLQDATTVDLSDADVVTVYLFPDVLESIRWDTLSPGARVVSYQHDIPGMEDKTHLYVRSIDGVDYRFWVYEQPRSADLKDISFLQPKWGLQ